MTIIVLLLIFGLVLTTISADWLVDGASGIARKAGLSEFIIGLTIVGIGTSLPELVVSMTGVIKGSSDVAIGNIVGSNAFNTFLILGLSALITPIDVTLQNRRKDLPLNLGVTILLILLGLNATIFGKGQDQLSRVDGAIFLIIFVLYLFSSFKVGTSEESTSGSSEENVNLFKSVILILFGIAGLIIGGNIFVTKATEIARALNVSDKFIAITILAGGTSLPELATCVVAAVKKKGDLAFGNIVGSNISNILLILGCSSVVRPVSLAGLEMVDLIAVITGAVVLLLSAYTFSKDKLDRVEAVILLLCEVAYFTYLLETL